MVVSFSCKFIQCINISEEVSRHFPIDSLFYITLENSIRISNMNLRISGSWIESCASWTVSIISGSTLQWKITWKPIKAYRQYSLTYFQLFKFNRVYFRYLSRTFVSKLMSAVRSVISRIPLDRVLEYLLNCTINCSGNISNLNLLQ